MIVKELIEQLKKCDENAHIWISTAQIDEFMECNGSFVVLPESVIAEWQKNKCEKGSSVHLATILAAKLLMDLDV